MAVPCATLEVEPWCEAQRDLNADPTSLGGATGGVVWAIGVRSCMRADDVANRSSAFISPHTVIDPVASAVEVGVGRVHRQLCGAELLVDSEMPYRHTNLQEYSVYIQYRGHGSYQDRPHPKQPGRGARALFEATLREHLVLFSLHFVEIGTLCHYASEVPVCILFHLVHIVE